MPKLPRLTAADAEAMLLKADFVWLLSKGSHRIYAKVGRRVAVPFHSNVTLHPKIVKQSSTPSTKPRSRRCLPINAEGFTGADAGPGAADYPPLRDQAG